MTAETHGTARLTTLPSGLRIVTERIESVETASLGAWIGVGARFETPDLNGVSHFLEHMAFKGTARRPARAIAEEIEDVGGHLNAYTSREVTAYHATVLKSDVAVAADIIADILLNSVFDETELARERAVILQEINQTNDLPDEVVFDRFQERAFPDQPVGRPVLGTPEIVGGMPRAALIDYMRLHYTAPRLVFSAAGKLEHEAVVDFVQQGFSQIGAAAGAPADAAVYGGGDFRAERDLEQVHLVLGFEGLPYEDPDYYALSVLSTLLGGGMSSRLFQEIRETLGLCYTVYTFGSSYTDSGLFGIYAATGEEEAADLVAALCREIRNVRDDLTSEGELARARAQIKSSVLMTLESTASRAEQLARQVHVFGRPLALEEMTARIDAVAAEDVMRVARRVLASPPTVAALGPISKVASYEVIREGLA